MDSEDVAEQLVTFQGVKRRAFLKNDWGYGVNRWLRPSSSWDFSNDWCVMSAFPEQRDCSCFSAAHLYWTIALLSEFVEALDKADSVYLCDIFTSAREQSGGIEINDLFVKLEKGEKVLSLEDVSLAWSSWRGHHFHGAGDIQKYEQAFSRLTGSQWKQCIF